MTVVRIKSAQLVGKYGFTVCDQPDIEQELLVDLIVGLRRFDPARAKRETFITAIVQRSVARVIRHRRQPMRDYRRCLESLDRVVADDGVTVLEVVDRGADDRERIDLRIDLAHAWSTLPAQLGDLVRGIGEESVADIERRTGRTREVIRHAVRRVRKRLADQGMAIHLPANQSSPPAHT
jgi:RNA polymerase sigma-70 factor (ECF subfamily)